MTTSCFQLCLLSIAAFLLGCTSSFAPSTSFLKLNHRHESVLFAKTMTDDRQKSTNTIGNNSNNKKGTGIGGLVLPHPNLIPHPNQLKEWTQGIVGDFKTSIATVINDKASSLLGGFTGKATYEFGDLHREMLRRLESSHYSDDDIRFLSRLMVGLVIFQRRPCNTLQDTLGSASS